MTKKKALVLTNFVLPLDFPSATAIYLKQEEIEHIYDI